MIQNVMPKAQMMKNKSFIKVFNKNDLKKKYIYNINEV